MKLSDMREKTVEELQNAIVDWKSAHRRDLSLLPIL